MTMKYIAKIALTTVVVMFALNKLQASNKSLKTILRGNGTTPIAV